MALNLSLLYLTAQYTIFNSTSEKNSGGHTLPPFVIRINHSTFKSVIFQLLGSDKNCYSTIHDTEEPRKNKEARRIRSGFKRTRPSS